MQSAYADLAASGDLIFAPVAIESLGVWGPSALDICAEIRSRIATKTGDPRFLSFLKQRLSVAIQRGNALAVTGTVPWGNCDTDFLNPF